MSPIARATVDDGTTSTRERYGKGCDGVDSKGYGCGASHPLRGCRVVTTALTARVLLANQLRSLPTSTGQWSAVTTTSIPPDGRYRRGHPHPKGVRAVRIQPPSRLNRVLSSPAVRLRPDSYTQGIVSGPCSRPAGGQPGRLHHPRSARIRGKQSEGKPPGLVFRTLVLPWANRVLVQSQKTNRSAGGRICSRDKMAYIGNGIVMERFLAPIAPSMHSNLPIVMMVSRLVTEKGCTDFLGLARSLRGQADFVHVGPSEHDQSDALSEEEMAAATEAGTMAFVGAVEDVRPYLASATLIVLPSYREGIPRVAMEAAVMGRHGRRLRHPGRPRGHRSPSAFWSPRGPAGADQRSSGAVEGSRRCTELGIRCRQWVVTRFSEDTGHRKAPDRCTPAW